MIIVINSHTHRLKSGHTLHAQAKTQSEDFIIRIKEFEMECRNRVRTHACKHTLS